MLKPISLLTFLLLAPLVANRKVLASGEAIKNELSPEIRRILKKQRISSDSLYFSLRELQTNKEEGYQSENPFIPASLTKIFTAFYALEVLGSDYRYETRLLKKGILKDGVFKGDLYLKGYGDPTLTMARLMDMVLDLKKEGVTKVEGNFIYDDSSLPSIPMLSTFGLGDQTYNPGVSALNLEFNRITIHKSGNLRTKKAIFETMPPMAHFHIEKTNQGLPLDKRFEFSPDSGGEVWNISNKLKYGIYEDLPVRRPSRRTAEVFKYLASLWSMELPSPTPGVTPENASLVSKELSQPLLKILALTLEFSNNLYAEQILLTATGKKDISQAGQALSAWLKKNTPSCDLPLINGSGLTSEHQIKAKCLTDFLYRNALTSHQSRGFMSLLSINGNSGWLSNRLKDPETSFRLWAKTGSLDYIDNVAGILFSRSGKQYAFTLSLFDKELRALLDEATSAYNQKQKPPSPRKAIRAARAANKWRKKARITADKILDHFIRSL